LTRKESKLKKRTLAGGGGGIGIGAQRGNERAAVWGRRQKRRCSLERGGTRVRGVASLWREERQGKKVDDQEQAKAGEGGRGSPA